MKSFSNFGKCDSGEAVLHGGKPDYSARVTVNAKAKMSVKKH